MTVSTDGGPAILRVPGGPYALTADSDGGPELIGIATDPAARASIKVTSGGGPILVGPPSAAAGRFRAGPARAAVLRSLSSARRPGPRDLAQLADLDPPPCPRCGQPLAIAVAASRSSAWITE